jgi:hypothetical protein
MRNAWFIRHTKALSIEESDISTLWTRHKIAVHFPGTGKKSLASTDPEDYRSDAAAYFAMSRMKRLSELGGYVWAEYRGHDVAQLGEIKQQKIELLRATWAPQTKAKRLQFPQKAGQTTVLKTLQLENVRYIQPDQYIWLRSAKPRYRTISPWHGAGNKLESILKGKALPREWDMLSTPQQEIVCSEFLRAHRLRGLPRLKRLLLPPGRSLPDIDVYGVSEGGRLIYAQVTFSGADEKTKVKALQKYRASGECLFFCQCDCTMREDGITFVPTALVHSWLKNDRGYSARLFR